MIVVLLQKCTNSTLMVLQARRTGSLLLDQVTTKVSALATMSETKRLIINCNFLYLKYFSKILYHKTMHYVLILITFINHDSKMIVAACTV